MTQLQPQLTGIATESVDCGVRATSMAIDWATHGLKVPPVKVLRTRMGKTDVVPTNPGDWYTAITSYDTAPELGGQYERLTASKLEAAEPSLILSHLRRHKAAVVAVDYGLYRRLLPRKSGSESFDGLHGILFTGYKDGMVTSWDSLLDGRYAGCPDGPVRVPWADARDAAMKAGATVGHPGKVYAVLVNPATKLGGGVILPPVDEPPSLTSILADLRALNDDLQLADLSDSIADLESLIGPYRGQADPGDQPATGVQP